MSAQPSGAAADLSSPAAPTHAREAERLAALHRYGILDTSREQEFDDIAD